MSLCDSESRVLAKLSAASSLATIWARAVVLSNTAFENWMLNINAANILTPVNRKPSNNIERIYRTLILYCDQENLSTDVRVEVSIPAKLWVAGFLTHSIRSVFTSPGRNPSLSDRRTFSWHSSVDPFFNFVLHNTQLKSSFSYRPSIIYNSSSSKSMTVN